MWFDSLIGFFSPRSQLKREQYRLHLSQLRKYDAAGRGRRWKGNRATGLSVNAENAGQKNIIRNRARDLVRNNAYAQKAVHGLSTQIVGKGIMPAMSPNDLEMRNAWRRWAETTECDYDGRLNLYGLQQLFMRTIVESGECLIRKRAVRRSDSSIGIKLQILEPDFIDDQITIGSSKVVKGHKIIEGIEFDPQGRRTYYHLFENHPGNNGVDLKIKNTLVSKPIKAENIIHGYRIDRPGQVRGVSWLHAVALRLKEIKEYEDAQLIRQKIAACYAGFIRDMDGDIEKTQSEIDAIEKFEPGMIEELGPGKTIEFANPPQVSDSYDAYMSSMLHGVAAGLNMSYEALTGDLSQVNFSSARMGWLDFHRNIEVWRERIMIGQFCNPVYNWFAGQLNMLDESIAAPDMMDWTAPRRDMIDPTKEVPAKIKEIRAGLSTLSDAIRERGKNPRDYLTEYKSDNDMLDELNLKLDTDARIDADGAQNENNPAPAAD
jgi:lambda family phage portal protein